jgi:hypothetical protein
VDGSNYTAQQTFQWLGASSHTISTTGTQSGGAGTQYVWSSWSDGGGLSHSVAPGANTTYTANFGTQYYLTMDADAGGTVSPASGWTNSGAAVNISATAAGGYDFDSWTGSGSGSYSGNSNPSALTMNGPITESASFSALTLMSSENPSGYLDGVYFTATMSPAPPSGQIVFYTNGVAFDTEALSGGIATSVITPDLPRGTNAITAQFTGNVDYSGTATLAGGQVVTNHPPTLNAANYTRIAGWELVMAISDLLTNASDVDGDTLTLGYISPSTNGTTLASDGTYIYYTNSVPNNVNDAFTFYVSDGFGGSATNTVFIAIDNSQSGLSPLNINVAGGIVQLTFNGLPNYEYILQRSTNLVAGAGWVGISTNITSTNALFTITDTFTDIGSAPPTAYYQLLVP